MTTMMRDDEPGPSNRKRPREPDYDADDEDSERKVASQLEKVEAIRYRIGRGRRAGHAGR